MINRCVLAVSATLAIVAVPQSSQAQQSGISSRDWIYCTQGEYDRRRIERCLDAHRRPARPARPVAPSHKLEQSQ